MDFYTCQWNLPVWKLLLFCNFCISVSPFRGKIIGIRQEQTQRYITHTTTNTQPAFGSVLIEGSTKFEGSKNVSWLIQDRLFQIELAFNCWNISAYLSKKWIYYCEIIMLRNKTHLITSNFVLSWIRIVYIFESAMLVRHRLNESQLI